MVSNTRYSDDEAIFSNILQRILGPNVPRLHNDTLLVKQSLFYAENEAQRIAALLIQLKKVHVVQHPARF